MELYKDMKIKKKANLKMIRNLVFFIGLIIFTFWYIFKDQDLNELLNILKSVDLKYIFVAILVDGTTKLPETLLKQLTR